MQIDEEPAYDAALNYKSRCGDIAACGGDVHGIPIICPFWKADPEVKAKKDEFCNPDKGLNCAENLSCAKAYNTKDKQKQKVLKSIGGGMCIPEEKCWNQTELLEDDQLQLYCDWDKYREVASGATHVAASLMSMLALVLAVIYSM